MVALGHPRLSPRVLLFDEATSALDNQTQHTVAESVVATRATRLVIAHRLSTVRDADRIVVLQNGVVVETGTYDDLMATRGAFYDLTALHLAGPDPSFA